MMEVGYLTDKKEDILKSGRELFSSKGFKDTKVSDIAIMAGIGVGTFYSYYTSKEDLFLEIYIKESGEIKKDIMDSIDRDDDSVTMVTKFVTQNINAMNSNLILKEWHNRDLFRKMKQYFYEQGGLESIDRFIHSGKVELNNKWNSKEKIRDDLDYELISAMFYSILYIDIHKNEIGIQHFPQVLHYISEFIMKGLTEAKK